MDLTGVDKLVLKNLLEKGAWRLTEFKEAQKLEAAGLVTLVGSVEKGHRIVGRGANLSFVNISLTPAGREVALKLV